MVERSAPEVDIDRVFHALADATRRDILRRTLVDEQSVSALAAGYAMSFAAVSKHIAVLAEARLITKRADGRVRLVRADPAVLRRAQDLLRSYEDLWRGRIDRLDALLAEPAAGATASSRRPAVEALASAPPAAAPDRPQRAEPPASIPLPEN